ncbi:hypothetical protein GNI_099220 [Gregarina niphandrodes]|uniref:Uncharacterized protein n=1 Tax=Gregarina niphandrodes TaxID=110365 RepID=A0A023B4Y1_GRENI|nr:hypothetical protein GNI_099220 [Gregarina niphandrodes]EZG57135.1 hypothetical protein GNI_099220 [Gregarina niphandrodes]|eukprot:XP_011131094.1 hypothetical protein GNI_099220 [Gregarina niphandrodes]
MVDDGHRFSAQAEDYGRMLGRGNLPLDQFFKEAKKPVVNVQDLNRTRKFNAEDRFQATAARDLIPVIGRPEHGFVSQGMDTSKDEGLTPLLAKETDTPIQRNFLEELPLFHPSSWYVPMTNHSFGMGYINQIRAEYEKKKHPASMEEDTALVCGLEWHSARFEAAPRLLAHQAVDRLKESGRVLLGATEEANWLRNEIESVTPIHNPNTMIQLLGEVVDPLPEVHGKGISTHEISVIRRLAPRRPMRLYPCLMKQHPVYRELEEPKKKMQETRTDPQLWMVTRNQSGKFGYVCQPLGDLEAMVTIADANRVDKQVGTDDVEATEKGNTKQIVDVTIEHDKPPLVVGQDEQETRRIQCARQKLITNRYKHKWQKQRVEVDTVMKPRELNPRDMYLPRYQAPTYLGDQAGDNAKANRKGDNADKSRRSRKQKKSGAKAVVDDDKFVEAFFNDSLITAEAGADTTVIIPEHGPFSASSRTNRAKKIQAAKYSNSQHEIEKRLEDWRSAMYNRIIAPIYESRAAVYDPEHPASV